MGYSVGEAPEPVTLMVNEVREEIKDLEGIRAEYIIRNDVGFDRKEKMLNVGTESFFIKPIIFNQVRKATGIVMFLCTAGKEIGNLSRQYMKSGDLLKGYIYDMFGSEIVEAAADRMQEYLKTSMIAAGMNITNRFSPGYCGWDVAEQHKLFSFFENNFCGITLSESALMDPVKSVSGIIGTGEEVSYAPYQCRVCDDKKCIYRNRK